MKIFVLFVFLAGTTILVAPKIHADDYDDQKAAQQLNDIEKQEAADEKAQYDRNHPQQYGDSSISTVIFGTLIIAAPAIYIFSKAFGKTN